MSVNMAVDRLRAAATFPRTRTALAERSLAALWLGALVPLALLVAFLRSRMDNVGFPVHGAGGEEALFGSLPTLWLQQHTYPVWENGFSWLFAIIHGSWFVIPWLAVPLFVFWSRPDRLHSLVLWWALLYAISLPVFALLPMQPPWMANEDVTRILLLRVGEIEDSNSLAAMPSLHVALPLVIALWLIRERCNGAAYVMFGYAALISTEVVFSGEHYVIDALGAVAVASAVALLARVDFAGFLARRVRKARTALAERPAAALPALARVQRNERGQALIEMALILPLMAVFILVLVDFGIALDRREVLQHAVREGARSGAVGADAATIKQRTVDQSQDVLTLADVRVVYLDGPDANTTAGDSGDNVRVQACFTYRFSMGGGEMLTFFGVPVPSISMNPTADMRLENAVDPPPNDTQC